MKTYKVKNLDIELTKEQLDNNLSDLNLFI